MNHITTSRKFYLLIFISALSVACKGQKYGIITDNYLSLHIGMVYSSFEFAGGGNRLSTQLDPKAGLNLGVSYIRWISERQNMGIELNYIQGGSLGQTQFSTINWDLTMAGGTMYYGYKVINKYTYALEPGILAGIDYILIGNQYVNGKKTSLLSSQAFSPLLYKAGVTIKNYIFFQDYIDLVIEYRYNRGLNNIEKIDYGLGQKTTHHYHMLNLGIRIHI